MTPEEYTAFKRREYMRKYQAEYWRKNSNKIKVQRRKRRDKRIGEEEKV